LNIPALVRATSVFLSTLAHRPPPSGPPPPRLSFTAAPQPGVDNRCPVCQARFRGVLTCSRCGADLEPLMRLTVKAWQLREAARHALASGDIDRAVRLAAQAQDIQDTQSGGALKLLGPWLKAAK
jgi:hypothetical protein